MTSETGENGSTNVKWSIMVMVWRWLYYNDTLPIDNSTALLYN